MGVLVRAPKIDIDFAEGQQRSVPGRRVWCAVIHQAVEDLFFLPKLTNTKSRYVVEKMRSAKNIRKSAYNFLFLNAPSFMEHRRLVFENAGIALIEMGALRKRANEFETENS